MSRALRRHPQAKGKGSRARGAASPISRPTPGRAPARGEGRGIGGILHWRPRFVMDIVNELRKVVWPSRHDTTYLTMVVIIVAIILGAVLGGIDIGFGWLIDRTLLR